MEPLVLNLRPESFSRKFDVFYAPSAGIVGLAMIVLAILDKHRLGWITMVAGATMIIQAIVTWRGHKAVATTWDSSGIRGDVSHGKTIAIRWNEIADITASTYALDIHLHDHTTVIVDLSQATYQQHKELKPRLLDLARTNGVDVRVA